MMIHRWGSMDCNGLLPHDCTESLLLERSTEKEEEEEEEEDWAGSWKALCLEVWRLGMAGRSVFCADKTPCQLF
jgi:hypothetical protein